MKKLTDEELSLVLSEQAAGKLDHYVWRNEDCGCIAGAVLDLCGDEGCEELRAAVHISEAVSHARSPEDFGINGYPEEPEAMLDLLARAGL